MKTWKAAALADLHCGCPRLDPFHFRDTIEKYVITRILKGDLSHVFIAGDFFDLSITMNSSASMCAMSVISMLKESCYRTGAKLRILRGTYTHDRNQPMHFLSTSPEFNSCVALHDSLSLEYDEDTKMNFLYIPDNLKFSDIYEEVGNLLKSHGLDKVDVVIHHGYFKHMLPPGIPEPHGTLDYEEFHKFYSGCVLNGHVHTSSIWNNVLSIGSFDRFVYGEEEPKGFYIVYRDDNLYKYEFIENKDANPFWTIRIDRFLKDSGSAIEYIKEDWIPRLKIAVNNGLTPHVRLLSDDLSTIYSCREFILKNTPTTIINHGISTKQEQVIENIKVDLEELPKITPDNLESLLMPIIKERYPSIDENSVHSVIEGLRKKG